MKKKDENLKEKKKSKAKTLIRFYSVFILFIAIFAVIYPIFRERFKAPIEKFISFTANLVGGFLNIFGAGTQVEGKIVSTKNFFLEVVPPCVGSMEMLFFTAAVLAFPSDYKKKLWGILIFIPIIYGLNILRTSLLVVAGNWSMGAFYFAHIYLFQVSEILFIIVFWLLWIKKVVRYEGKFIRIFG